MTAVRVYLDHNATSPLRPEAAAAMGAAMAVVGNPSSIHGEGRHVRSLIERAREQVAALVNAKPTEVVFTSGATEANAWVVAGGGWDVIATSQIEHESVRAAARRGAVAAIGLGVDEAGLVDAAALGRGNFSGRRRLLSVQAANNETGIVQPLRDVAAMARDCGFAVHTDAVQAVGKIGFDFADLGVDYLSMSAHKLGGPAGVGALVIRDGAQLSPVITGGGQERRLRAGTENIIGIVGFGAAAAAAGRGLAAFAEMAHLRDRLEQGVRQVSPAAMIIGDGCSRLPNTSAIALPGVPAHGLVIKLDLAGFAVSAGAACSSGKVASSHVLAAMGLPHDIASSTVRVSLGWTTTAPDVDAFITAWSAVSRPRDRRAA